MSYTPTTWETGDVITAALLNKMENGIADAGGSVVKDLVSTDITLTAQADTRYIYGELESLTVSSLPSEGIVDILFISGTTATVLDLPQTVQMPGWFSVEPSKVIEINILDGVYGSVLKWDYSA